MITIHFEKHGLSGPDFWEEQEPTLEEAQATVEYYAESGYANIAHFSHAGVDYEFASGSWFETENDVPQIEHS